ncbi:PTB domain-containing adapter protein ced-6 [Papilio machaon]|uniref:PTB domain-containing adapter protein ced-6 n=1 Tax=Papilio machaon TaxID=76193 RepID=A0A194QZY4_PAPMA|nr:PTB domain-containing adapter protein ced-6 [Papilio machaon]
MSTLLFWQGRGKANGAPNGRNWIHAPDALVKGHVAYLVKFLGCTQVDQPKGIEVVKDAIKKLQFTQQLKKSETKDGAKCKKVEITISVDGVAIQEPRSNNILYQFPLHRISYCADDKGAKKYFSFIAKGGSTVNGMNGHDSGSVEKHECFVFVSTKLASEITLTIGQAFDLAYRKFPLHRISYCADDKGAKKYFSFIAKGGSTVNGMNGHDSGSVEKHECFVFVSTKLASEITLTIGQAFDLAYRRFLNDNGKYIEMQKLTLQNRKLELQMNVYKNRLQELSKITYKDDLSAYLARNSLSEITEFKAPQELDKQIASLTLANGFSAMNGNKTSDNGGDAMSNNSTDTFNSSDNNLLLATPPPAHNGKSSLATGYVCHLISQLSYFDPRAFESEPASRFAAPAEAPPTAAPPLLAPPPKASKRQTSPQQVASPINGQTQQMSPINGNDLFGSTPFSIPNQTVQATSPFTVQNTNKPNYDISDFNLQTSVFNSNTFTNGLTGYDPFDTQKTGNIFGNGFGNTFNGFGNLSEKQTVELDSSFNGFLDKTISEMKDGFSRGISFGNEDFSIDNLDPLKKN